MSGPQAPSQIANAEEQRPARRPTRRWLLIGLGIALSGGLLYLSFRNIDITAVIDEIAAIHVLALLIFPILRLNNFLIPALRSRILFAPLSPQSAPSTPSALSYWRLLKSVFLAFAVNNVIPLRAGDVARIGYLSHHGDLPASTCLAVVAFERLLDLFVLAVIVLCTLPLMAIDLPLGTAFYIFSAGVGLAIASALWVSRYPDTFRRLCVRVAGLFGSWVRRLVDNMAGTLADGLSALKSASAVFGVIACSVMFWLIAACIVQTWLWALGIDLPWYAPIVVLASLSLGLAMPSTPGNVGTFHFFASSALIALGTPETQALSFAIVAHAMALVPFTLLAIPLLLRDYLALSRRR
ncbi:MAG: lysylphosphatidylglycerol synthase transmembrane domain-containing protein [Myxococcota bacterium]